MTLTDEDLEKIKERICHVERTNPNIGSGYDIHLLGSDLFISCSWHMEKHTDHRYSASLESKSDSDIFDSIERGKDLYMIARDYTIESINFKRDEAIKDFRDLINR